MRARERKAVPAAHVGEQLLLLATSPKFGNKRALSGTRSCTPGCGSAGAAGGEQTASYLQCSGAEFHTAKVIRPAGGDCKLRGNSRGACSGHAPLLTAAVGGSVAKHNITIAATRIHQLLAYGGLRKVADDGSEEWAGGDCLTV